MASASATSPLVHDGGDLRPLKVLVLIDHLALGGAEMLLGQFAAAAPAAGIELSVACLMERDGNPAAEPLRRAGIDPINLGCPGRPGWATLRRVRQHIQAVDPDLVHTHLGTSDWVGALAARSAGVPVISTVHQATWERDPETVGKRMLVRLLVRRVITVSDEAARHYRSRIFGADRQIERIYNGIDVSPVPGAGAEVRAEQGWGKDHLVVGMVSALRPEKAHLLAIEAVALLTERFPMLRLLIVGGGPCAAEVEAAARHLGDRVKLTGPRSDVMRCMDAFDVCLQPSRSDAFPTTLIEAMAASVPVLATEVGGIPEMIEHEVNGILVPPPPSPRQVAEALGRLLEDAGLRRKLGASGRELYQRRFTAGPWARATRRVYDQVLSGGGQLNRADQLRRRWHAHSL